MHSEHSQLYAAIIGKKDGIIKNAQTRLLESGYDETIKDCDLFGGLEIIHMWDMLNAAANNSDSSEEAAKEIIFALRGLLLQFIYPVLTTEALQLPLSGPAESQTINIIDTGLPEYKQLADQIGAELVPMLISKLTPPRKARL